MKITTIRTTGLGDSTYLLAHEGAGLIVDPQRDVDRFERALADEGVALTHVLETHLHNDYISGGRQLAVGTGADLVLPAAGGVAFSHVPAFHQEDLEGGPYVIRPIHTPGHTPEHLSYLILIDEEPVAVFSGGSLLVGSAGRSDLLGDHRAEQLARLQYGSVRRLAGLPDATGLYPTHGEGSFCTFTSAGGSTSTIGRERKSNPVLQYENADEFVSDQLAGLQPFPTYYAHMGPINLEGPEPLPEIVLPELDAPTVSESVSLVDVRPRASFAAGHIPRSIGIEIGDRVGVWAGWLLPFDTEVALVAERGQDVVDVAKQFARIGFDHVVGVIYDIEAWATVNGELSSFDTATADDLYTAIQSGQRPQILDVRAPGDWAVGSIDGSIKRYTPFLKDGLPEELDRERDVWVVCATGFRALAAAAYVEQGGFRPVVVTAGGVPDVLHRTATGAEG